MKKFQDFSKDILISQRFLKISRRFLRFLKDFQDFSKISKISRRFRDFRQDFQISLGISAKAYEISGGGEPLGPVRCVKVPGCHAVLPRRRRSRCKRCSTRDGLFKTKRQSGESGENVSVT